MRIVIPTLAMALGLCSFSAAAAEPDQEKSAETRKTEKSKKICKNIEEGMSSRRKKRICLTKEEWVDFNQGE